jgi:hypothetical protein
MTDDELIEGFEGARLEAFHHADHVRVAWIYLQRLGLHRALEAVSEGLKRLAATHGHEAKYHATVSWLYVFVIHERMAAAEGADDWDDFAARNPDLLGGWGSFVARYYSPRSLSSALARREFVLPDRAPRSGHARDGATS